MSWQHLVQCCGSAQFSIPPVLALWPASTPTAPPLAATQKRRPHSVWGQHTVAVSLLLVAGHSGCQPSVGCDHSTPCYTMHCWGWPNTARPWAWTCGAGLRLKMTHVAFMKDIHMV